MKSSFTVTRGVLAVTVLALSATAAQAQFCPPTAGTFTKQICRINPTGPPPATCTPPAAPVAISPGDIIEYEVIRCNPNPMACDIAQILDNLDNNLLDPAHLTYVEADPTIGCGTAMDFGGSICQVGTPGAWSPAPTGRCGQDCGNPTDDLAMVPGGALPPNQCWRMVFWAQVDPTLTASTCLCNQAQTPISFMGATNSNDPNWASLDDGSAGCTDLETCPIAGECETCVRLATQSVLDTSVKCIDTLTPCGMDPIKSAGDMFSYFFDICNTGGSTAPLVLLTDDLSFLSQPGNNPCLALGTDPTLTVNTCPATACTPSYTNPNVMLVIEELAVGDCVEFQIDTEVNVLATDTCTNEWVLQIADSIPPRMANVNPVSFSIDSSMADLTTTKDGPMTVPAGDPVPFTITVENTGMGMTSAGQLVDTMDPCFEPLGMDGAPCDLVSTVQCFPPMFCGPPATCTYSNGGRGFTINGLTMNVGDSFNMLVTAQAGLTPGACTNNLNSSPNTAGPSSHTVQIGAASGADLSTTKTGPAAVATSDPVPFVITVTNAGVDPTTAGTVTDTMDGCFEPLGMDGAACDLATVVVCNPASFCAAPATCVYSNGGRGFTLSNVTMQPADSFTIDLAAQAGPLDAMGCTNMVSSSPTTGTPAEAMVDIGTVNPGITVTKGDIGAAPATNGTFTITVENTSGADLMGCRLTDDVEATSCMTLVTGGCREVAPTPAPMVDACTAGTPAQLTFDLPMGATHTYEIDVLAGTPPMEPFTCMNNVTVECGAVIDSDSGDLTISSAQCILRGADLTSPPPTPAFSAVYVDASCAGDPRLDAAGPSKATFAPGTPTNTSDDIDPTAGQLILYQLDCANAACVGPIFMIKDDNTMLGTPVRVEF